MADDEGPLSQVIEYQGGKDEVPCPADRLPPQMPHVGIEGFTAGCTEDDLREDEEAREAVFQQERNGILGADGLEDSRMPGDGYNAGEGRARNQRIMMGPKVAATLSVPLNWKTNSSTAISAAIGISGSLMETSHARNQVHPLNGRQDTDGGGNDSVSQEEGNSQEGEKADECHLASRLQRRVRISLSTMVPPSPLRPRLMASQAYSTETRMVRVQTTSERIPSTLSGVGLVRAKMTVRV